MDDTPVEDSVQDEMLEDELHGYEVNEVHRLYLFWSTSYGNSCGSRIFERGFQLDKNASSV